MSGGAAAAAEEPKSDLVDTLKTGSYFALWYLFNIGYNIYNKQALNALDFPWTIATIQMATGILYFAPLWALGLRKAPKLSGADLKTLLPIALCHTGVHVGAVIALGAGLWITALTVKFRDFRFITPFILQIGMFVTPVGYRTDILPTWRDLLALNPLSGVVDGMRWCLLGGRTDIYPPALLSSVVIGVLLLATGIWYFRRTERQFADVI